MTPQTKYFHDRLIMLLLSTNVFLAFLTGIFILLRLGSNHGNGYIVQCRDCSNLADINRFTNGNVLQLLDFVGFVVLILGIHVILSLRTYRINRQLAIVVLSLGVLLLLLTLIVGNALLVLR